MSRVDGGAGQSFREDVARATRVAEGLAVLVNEDGSATLLIVRHGMRMPLARDERAILARLLARPERDPAEADMVRLEAQP